MNITDKIKKLLFELNKGAFEREEVIGLSLLSAIAGESIFLLGLPGVGKSMIARRLKLAFKNAKNFEYLMSRFSTPDEIFGPVSISKLKDNDSYERVIDGYLPTADVIFLDEIFKAGPAIQNALLTVLNEKIFHNGKEDIFLPLKAIISASNELPAKDEGLEALWDRFLIRYIVKPISDKNMFVSLICNKQEDCIIDENLKLSSKELKEISKQIDEIKIPRQIAEIVFSIRQTLIDEKIKFIENNDVTKTDLIEPPYVSDRRFKKIMRILKTSAYLNDRQNVDFSDCLLMEHMLWDNDQQIDSVQKLVIEAIANYIHSDGFIEILENVHSKNYTKPVGNPICPDGIHYIFMVGEDQMLISKNDYQNMPEDRSVFGQIINDNQLILSPNPTSLQVIKTKFGLNINSFSYQLKRDSSLISGDVNNLINDIKQGIGNIEQSLKIIVENNIFINSTEKFQLLKKAFNSIKNKITNQ